MLEWIHNIDAQILLFIQQYLRSDLFTWLWKGMVKKVPFSILLLMKCRGLNFQEPGVRVS